MTSGKHPALLRRPEVMRRTGLRQTRIDELERAGEFPRRVQLSIRAVAWVESEVSDYIRARIAERDKRLEQREGMGNAPIR
jgi:prophage regulatory protein